MRTRTKLMPVFMFALLSLFLFLPTSSVQGAAATAASIELSSDSFLEGSPVTIRVYNVVASGASFRVYFTYDSSGTDTIEAKASYANISVDLATNEDEWVRTMIFEAPTAGAYIRVHVAGSAGEVSSDLDAAQCDATDVEDLLPTDLIITIGVALMIILIIVGIVVGLARKGSRR